MRQFRWMIMLMIFFACMINFLDRSALAYVIEPLQTHFGINNAQFGLISSVFGLSYLCMTICGGLIVDRFGARLTLTISSALWSITSALMGIASGFIGLFLLRILLGLAEGPAFPSLTRVSGDWLPAHERAKAIALSLAAVPFSCVIGAPIITTLIDAFGWQTMFVILGLAGLIWSILWYWIFSDKPNDSKWLSPSERAYIISELSIKKANTPKPLGELFKNKDLLLAYCAYFCLGYILAFSVSWLPGYFRQIFNIPLKDMGWYLCLPWGLATIFILIGGSISDQLWNKTQNLRVARSQVIAISQLLSGVSFLPILYFNDFWIALIGLSFGLAFSLLPMSAFYALNTDLAYESAGTSQGLMSSFLGTASFIAPAVTGLLVHQTKAFDIPILIMALLSISCSMLIFIFHINPMKFSRQPRASSLNLPESISS